MWSQRDDRLKLLLPKLEEVTRHGKLKFPCTAMQNHEMKGDDNPLTDADSTNELLKERLPPLVPGAGWLSEDGGRSLRLNKDWVWIVDPIDGTREFTLGILNL